MVDKILNELKNKLNGLSKCKHDGYITIGLKTRFTTMNNIVKADEILILDDTIIVQSGHLSVSFDLEGDMNATKYNYGFEDEYYIGNKEAELYLNLMGT